MPYIYANHGPNIAGNDDGLSNHTTSNIYPTTDWQVVVDQKTELIVDGRDVMKELDEIRDALLLLKREVDMEEKYPRLKQIKDQYEAELEKYKTFESVKNS